MPYLHALVVARQRVQRVWSRLFRRRAQPGQRGRRCSRGDAQEEHEEQTLETEADGFFSHKFD